MTRSEGVTGTSADTSGARPRDAVGRAAVVLRAIEVPTLLCVPASMLALAWAGVDATAGLTLLVVALSIFLLLASYEASRPALRQLMPTAVLAAVAAFVSNLFFGQGSWTPWQMYAWGLVGYVGGLLGRRGLLGRPLGRTCWGVLSGLVYGVLLNGYYVLGYVRPLTWQAVVAALTAGLPFDLLHGIATAGFLALIWNPWGRALRRVVAKYDLRR